MKNHSPVNIMLGWGINELRCPHFYELNRIFFLPFSLKKGPKKQFLRERKEIYTSSPSNIMKSIRGIRVPDRSQYNPIQMILVSPSTSSPAYHQAATFGIHVLWWSLFWLQNQSHGVANAFAWNVYNLSLIYIAIFKNNCPFYYRKPMTKFGYSWWGSASLVADRELSSESGGHPVRLEI